jgi:hypothetical protein
MQKRKSFFLGYVETIKMDSYTIPSTDKKKRTYGVRATAMRVSGNT